MRSAAFFGVDAVVITKNRSVQITDTSAKTSSGAIFKVPLIKEINLLNVIKILKKNNFFIYSTSPQGSQNLADVDITDKIALIIGNEEKGVRNLINENSDFVLRLDGKGSKIASLNASNSAAIFIYDIVRRMTREG